MSALVVGNPRVDRRLWAGLPDLPGALAEAAAVAALYPRARVLTGNEATKAAFLEDAPQSAMVHFAGHAVVNRDAPSRARLHLAADPGTGDSGALFLNELRPGDLSRARLVVLAACRTAGGPVSRVEGALSLARPFLAAGVPSVIASLWDIDDATSRRFFESFHRALIAGGEPVAALRQVQIEFLRSRDPLLSYPGSWAAFTHMGGIEHSLPQGEQS
jgi:CHAT domain-containing protein